MKYALAILFSGPFFVSLGFLLYSLSRKNTERLSWEIGRLISNLFWGIGISIMALSNLTLWQMVGFAIFALASISIATLDWLEHKAKQAVLKAQPAIDSPVP